MIVTIGEGRPHYMGNKMVEIVNDRRQKFSLEWDPDKDSVKFRTEGGVSVTRTLEKALEEHPQLKGLTMITEDEIRAFGKTL